MMVVLVASLTGCASTEPRRDVSTISSSKTKTLSAPKITQSDADGFRITYAEMSMEYDAGCDPFKGFSDKLNQCSELPENVKFMTIDHCEDQGPKSCIFRKRD